MRLFGGFSLGRWFGFEVRIDYSWFLLFFLVVWTLSAQEFPRRLDDGDVLLHYGMGTVAALLVFLSVLLHELSHSAVARARGLEVEGITLFIFGGVAQTRMEARTAADEFLLTAAGPLSSVALGGLFYALYVAADFAGWGSPVEVVAHTLFVINVALAVFNMIPGFPLDGGRIFRSAVWHFTGDVEKATRWATRGGQAFGYLLIGLGLALVFFTRGGLVSGMWAAFIGWFLSHAAASSWRQFSARRLLSHVPVGRVMTSDPVTVVPGARVADVVESLFLRHPYNAYPVVAKDGVVTGLLTLDDVAAVPAAERDATPVSAAMTMLDDVPTAEPGETLDDVLTRLGGSDLSRLLVVRDGELVGLVTMDEVAGWIERARKLGLDEDGPMPGTEASGAGRGPGGRPGGRAASDRGTGERG